jgi:hypothetical protein
MVKFEHTMKESTNLFKDEQRVIDISQRMAEQNDQLLSLLVDLNKAPQVPNRFRYDLQPKHLAKAPPKLDHSINGESGHMALRKARHQLQTGEITLADYDALEEQLLHNVDFAPKNSYATLTHSVSTLQPQRIEPQDPTAPEMSGFLTIKQEDQYLQSLDNYIDGHAPTPRAHASGVFGAKGQEKSTEQEREMQLRNPASVYNWLRKYHPKVFLQDNEPNSEKPPKQTGSRSSKRNINRDSIVKQEEDLYDDDGIAVEMGPSKGAKRKRDDDGGYRPKGGNSRPAKRKKEESSGKRSKKSSIDLR